MAEARMPHSEFSHRVRLSDLPAGGTSWTLEADEAERAALARRFGLEALDSLIAEISLEWVSGSAFLRLSGRIRASVVQACVVTLAPIRTELDEPIEILYEPGGAAEGEVEIEAVEDVEPLEGDSLDIAETAAEEMALMLDPYPRAPGASVEQLDSGLERLAGEGTVGDGDEKPPSPFEVLAGFRRKQ